jgi:UDP-N-acetylglucosamine--N-acetylmuramyl-(pentapeptide) pyrophosphoryl-undecaprenol N-acetylglucosamine transferase
VHILPAGRLGGGPIGWLKALNSVIKGRAQAKRLYREHTPDAVVGFGGYPAFPSLLAASAMRIPTLLHEQNAVLGRVNRLLAGEAEAIGTAYETVERLRGGYRGKAVLVGNPVREEVARLGELPFPPFDEFAPLKILIERREPGRDRSRRSRAGGSRPAPAFAAPAAPGRAAMPPRRYRARPQPLCRARHPR